jgi:hypothetical protein
MSNLELTDEEVQAVAAARHKERARAELARLRTKRQTFLDNIADIDARIAVLEGNEPAPAEPVVFADDPTEGDDIEPGDTDGDL